MKYDNPQGAYSPGFTNMESYRIIIYQLSTIEECSRNKNKPEEGGGGKDAREVAASESISP